MTPLDENCIQEVLDPLLQELPVDLNIEEFEEKEDFKTIFKKVKNEKKEKIFCKTKESVLPNLFDLASKPLTFDQLPCEVKIEKQEPIHAVILKIVEEVKTLSTVIHENGIQETSCTLQLKDSIFDGLEICVFSYNSAPFEYNVEIKSCASTLALLQKNLEQLSTQIDGIGLPFVFRRIDLSIKKSEQGNFATKSFVKPVKEAKNNFHDQQT
jgi:hypothetical protein